MRCILRRAFGSDAYTGPMGDGATIQEHQAITTNKFNEAPLDGTARREKQFLNLWLGVTLDASSALHRNSQDASPSPR